MMRHKTIIQVILLSLSMSTLSGCKEKAINPEDDIPLFKDFIEENIDKIADDPYISSTVKPDDEMYDLMLMLQRGDWSQTTWDEMDSLMKKGVENAKIIYARTKIDEIYKRSKATAILTELMSKGNPYATYWLSNKSNLCLSYLSSEHFGNKVAKKLGLDTAYENKYCTEEIYQKAVEGFKKLAAQGDLRAQYFLLKDQGLDKSIEKREEYIKEVIRFAEAHYYKPLMDYTSTLMEPSHRGRKFRSKELEKLGVKLFNIASNNYYIPAMAESTVYEADNNQLFERMKRSGDRYYFLATALDRSNELSGEEKYCHALLYEKKFKSKRYFGFDDEWQEKDDYDESICNIEKEVAEMKPMIYIDYFTRIDNWGRG
ncbi:hypothetical protein BZJ19_13990 [Salinivibrio proteolyticus]|uniref:hypothetical protein n=1 Tax=Salinivibrio proteolyticus TaxID=334715 RepID=UPI0009898E3E|nr:hypothetical protein [Salinivibrio proteolyticus]OOF23018.1 hypothetical protein BZJ19_13990 [Salinivibrio proteolyticus]